MGEGMKEGWEWSPARRPAVRDDGAYRRQRLPAPAARQLGPAECPASACEQRPSGSSPGLMQLPWPPGAVPPAGWSCLWRPHSSEVPRACDMLPLRCAALPLRCAQVAETLSPDIVELMKGGHTHSLSDY